MPGDRVILNITRKAEILIDDCGFEVFVTFSVDTGNPEPRKDKKILEETESWEA
jgi:hypothetical protein